MNSYRVEKRGLRKNIREHRDFELNPVNTSEGGGTSVPETDRLSAIIRDSSDLFGGIEWERRYRIIQTVTLDFATAVARDSKLKYARQDSDRENARVESDEVSYRAVLRLIHDNTKLYERFAENPDFRWWLNDKAFRQANATTG